jgi:hypothetical protein
LLKSITLKKFIELNKIDLKNWEVLIVDVEGAEWDLFEGAQNLLKTKDILWQVEFHLDEDWHRREILFENGYSIYDLDFRKLSKDDARPYQAILSKGDL